MLGIVLIVASPFVPYFASTGEGGIPFWSFVVAAVMLGLGFWLARRG